MIKTKAKVQQVMSPSESDDASEQKMAVISENVESGQVTKMLEVLISRLQKLEDLRMVKSDKGTVYQTPNISHLLIPPISAWPAALVHPNF